MNRWATLLLLLCAGTAWSQEGKKKKEAERPLTAGEILIPDPGTKVEDAAVARKEIVLFLSEMRKTPKKEIRKRVALIERLGQWDHPMILKEVRKYTKDKSYKVSVAAVVACARQTSEKEKTAAALLATLKKEKRNDVVCALLVAMGRMGYDNKKAFKAAADRYNKTAVEPIKAAARYFGYVKSKAAFRMLAEKLDYPRPAQVDDPANPPASWWEARYKEWKAYVPHVRWALNEIVPTENFDSTREARAWAESEGAKHGIKW
jgi:hypothetical protein